jgi:hypothetical protein
MPQRLHLVQNCLHQSFKLFFRARAYAEIRPLARQFSFQTGCHDVANRYFRDASSSHPYRIRQRYRRLPHYWSNPRAVTRPFNMSRGKLRLLV